MKCNSQNQLPAMGMATQDSIANSKMKFDTTKKVTDAGTNTTANEIAVSSLERNYDLTRRR